jgi:hypothetical protein
MELKTGENFRAICTSPSFSSREMLASISAPQKPLPAARLYVPWIHFFPAWI